MYRQAIEQYESLVKSELGMPFYRARLADSLFSLGTTFQADPKEAESILRRAVGVYQSLAIEAPEMSVFRKNLATTLVNLANLCFGAGRLRDAEVAATEARSLLEVLSEQEPTFVAHRERLAEAMMWLAKIHRQAGQTATALADAERARDLYDKLNPEALDLKWNHASNFANLAYLQEHSGNPKASESSWGRAVAQFQGLVNKAPENLDYRSDLAQCLTQLAMASARNGLTAETERNFRRTVELLEQVLSQAPERSADRLHLAETAHNFGYFLFLARNFKESERFTRIAFKAYERLFSENYQPEAMIRGCAKTMSTIASTQLETGRFADAADSYREALKLFGSMPPKLALEPPMREEQAKIHDKLGTILMLNGQEHDAEPQIQKGLEIREALLALAPNRPSYLDDLGAEQGASGNDPGQTG